MEKYYTMSVFCENRMGLVSRVSSVFTRRRLNIENFTASETEIKNVFRMAIVVKSTRERLEKVAQQIEKQIEVLKAFVHEDEDIIYQEVALYKVSTKLLQNGSAESLAKENGAKVMTSTPEYVVFEKMGVFEETQSFLNKLEKYGVIEFARSGRVVILKWSKRFHQHLQEFEQLDAK
ncbi:MAG: acetolactate synthase small subunit [Bacteroidota bacterium]